MNNSTKLSNINEALEDVRQGGIIIVVDDEDRENEGDFVTAAEKITPETVNFMITHGRGLVCAPLPESRCEELGLEMMVGKNTALHETPFTVAVDLLGHGCTTGISAGDRAKTIRALVDPSTKPEELGKPGHIFPLKALEKGVLRRAGHTEAAVDITRLAGLTPGGALVEILNDDGSMARLPELMKIAEKFNLKIITIKDLIEYRLKYENIIERGEKVKMPTDYGDFELAVYKQTGSRTEIDHIAIIKGQWRPGEAVLVRVHSSCVTGDIFGSCRCDCGDQLHEALRMIEQEGKGALIYLNQEGRGIGLFNKIHAYKLQEQGADTVEANLMLGFKDDERDYGIGAGILRDIGVTKMKLITNNPLKRRGLEGYGLTVVENIPLVISPNKHNKNYMHTKASKMGHDLPL